ncbi:MAG: hypothetical protein AAGJ18_17005 [Bacteroidota bacterium]
MKKETEETAKLIARDFGMEKVGQEELSEEELLRLLESQVAYYIEHRLEFLLSSLYRLDISEKLVRTALSPSSGIPANVGIAKLILERQKKRVFTKQFYKQPKIEDLEEGLEF